MSLSGEIAEAPGSRRFSRRRASPTSLRWALALVIPVGFLLTVGRIESSAVDYALLTLVSEAALCLLLSGLGRLRLALALPVWLLLSIFLISYYLKFYLILASPPTPSSEPGFFSSTAISDSVALATYECIITGFLAFVGVSLVSLAVIARNGSRTKSFSELRQRMGLITFRVALWCSVLLSSTVLAITYKYQLVMGLSVNWPYHLYDLFTLLSGSLLPSLFLLLLECALRLNARGAAKRVVAAVYLYAILNMVLTSSKGPVLTMTVALGVWWIARGGEIRIKQLALGVAAVSLTALLFLPFEAYRALLVTDFLEHGSVSYARVLQAGLPEADSAASGQSGGLSLLERLPGADMLVSFIDNNIRPAGLSGLYEAITQHRSVNWYLQRKVFGDFAHFGDTFSTPAPSWLGFCYAFGGFVGVFVGTAAAVLFVAGVWVLLLRLQPVSLPVLQASFLLTWALPVFEEGTPGYSRFGWLFVAVAIEWLSRVSRSSTLLAHRSIAEHEDRD